MKEGDIMVLESVWFLRLEYHHEVILSLRGSPGIDVEINNTILILLAIVISTV